MLATTIYLFIYIYLLNLLQEFRF